MEKLILKVENISKQYKLGQIGGTTFKEEVDRFNARILKKEDPTRKIGKNYANIGDTFDALKNISFEVKKGERVGIIGHNGAGKSTLLKLISRITAPTDGKIYLDGKVASMLEVGTGFHRELTGRENIYMNGAILGMKKAEIDKKIDDIIEFSECAQFIDTPVKRYSSGMYVKLAFAVAAHLDSEIMIMDEVLAVGDMAFQKKCLDKMNDISRAEGRTILYVSHNMNTIRQLCDRCIVLERGQLVFDGDVEKAINVYLSVRKSDESTVDLNDFPRNRAFNYGQLKLTKLELDNESSNYKIGENFSGMLTYEPTADFNDAILRFVLTSNGQSVLSSEGKIDFDFKKGQTVKLPFSVSLNRLAPATYSLCIYIVKRDEFGNEKIFERILNCYHFDIVGIEDVGFARKWNSNILGYLIGDDIIIG